MLMSILYLAFESFFFDSLYNGLKPSSYFQVWLYNIGLGSLIYEVEKICDGSGEDPSCSR